MNDTLKAAIWMTGAIVSFTCMAVAGRYVSEELDTFEIMAYRSMIGVAIIVSFLQINRRWSEIQTNRLPLHVIRNISHFAGQNLWFFALTILPLAEVIALEFTSPLWALILAPLVLGEKITTTRALAALVGFIGVVIVARPSPETLNIGQATAFMAAIGFALSALFTRRLTRDQSILCILFYLTTMQAVFGITCAAIDGDMTLPSLHNWPWVVAIAIAGLVAHFCLTTALSLAPAATVMPVDFARLPVMALTGWFLFSEQIDIFVIIGALVIFGANYTNLWLESHKSPRNGDSN